MAFVTLAHSHLLHSPKNIRWTLEGLCLYQIQYLITNITAPYSERWHLEEKCPHHFIGEWQTYLSFEMINLRKGEYIYHCGFTYISLFHISLLLNHAKLVIPVQDISFKTKLSLEKHFSFFLVQQGFYTKGLPLQRNVPPKELLFSSLLIEILPKWLSFVQRLYGVYSYSEKKEGKITYTAVVYHSPTHISDTFRD